MSAEGLSTPENIKQICCGNYMETVSIAECIYLLLLYCFMLDNLGVTRAIQNPEAHGPQRSPECTAMKAIFSQNNVNVACKKKLTYFVCHGN